MIADANAMGKWQKEVARREDLTSFYDKAAPIRDRDVVFTEPSKHKKGSVAWTVGRKQPVRMVDPKPFPHHDFPTHDPWGHIPDGFTPGQRVAYGYPDMYPEDIPQGLSRGEGQKLFYQNSVAVMRASGLPKREKAAANSVFAYLEEQGRV